MSYMDRDNILSEGFFDFLKKFKQKKNYTKAERAFMRNPEFRKQYKKTEKAVDDFLKFSKEFKI